MSHLDPEQLALIALGEPVASHDEREHLSSCAVCRAEVAEMAHAVLVARATVDEAELETPPDRVWESIADELRLASAHPVGEVPVGEAGEPEQVSEPGRAEASESVGEAASVTAPPPERHARRWSRRAWWTLAASAALILAIGGGVWVASGVLSPTSIASASLEAFPDHPKAAGTAEVDESRNGSRTLTVTLEGASSDADYREVWLIRNDGKALISLGVLQGQEGAFPIPEGVDLSQYDLVDISFEPVDGNPAHSGDSIVRGQLSFA